LQGADYMAFNENTRVKIPAILHLTRLGYEYVSLKSAKYNSNNIFTDICTESISRINPDSDVDILTLLEELKALLDYDDLGRAFYKRITSSSGIRLIDFNDFNNNSFHVCTELTYKNGEEEFRPDIAVLINGLPLIFIEVKKPNNPDGILAERLMFAFRIRNSRNL
jgi:type I restriction enzyme R subunit